MPEENNYAHYVFDFSQMSTFGDNVLTSYIKIPGIHTEDNTISHEEIILDFSVSVHEGKYLYFVWG